MDQPVTFRVDIIVKRAGVEFAPGMGVGVLVSQEVTYTAEQLKSPALVAASLDQVGSDLIRDAVEAKYTILA